jgi:hypothetical protein
MLMSIASEAKLKIGRESDFSLNPKFIRSQSAATHLLWFASTARFQEGKRVVAELL